MSEFENKTEGMNESQPNAASDRTVQNAPEQTNPQPSYQTSAYSYGRYGSEPIPEATRSGYYACPSAGQGAQGYPSQPGQDYAAHPEQEAPRQNPQPRNDWQGGYYTNPAGPGAAPSSPQKPPKKERRGLRTFLTAGIAAVTTAAVLLAALWGAGVFTREMPVRDPSSSASGSLSEPSSSESEKEAPAPNAFEIQPTPDDTSSVSPDGALTPAQVAAKVKQSVVCIENFSDNAGQTLQGEGSGIIFSVSGKEGYIITNAHVVEDAASLKVVMVDGSIYDAYLVGSDTNTDLAVIRATVEDQALIPAEFGDASKLEQGDYVMALGNPGGMAFSNSATYGIVSAVNRQVQTKNGYTMSCIQTDAAINPGNSGGPLVNMYGQVVGINSSKIVASGYEGLGFAISINEAQPVISDLMEYGYVKDRAYLGITYQFIDESTSRMYGLPVGVYIYSFTTDTLSSAGCKVGDIITHADGEELISSSVLINLLAEKKPGDQMTFTVYRAGDRFTQSETLEITVTLGEYTPEEPSQYIG